MNMTKRLFALFLAVVMVVSMLPVSVLADDSDVAESVEDIIEELPADEEAPSEEPVGSALTEAEILGEYLRLLDEGDEAAVEAFLGTLSDSQYESLMAAAAELAAEEEVEPAEEEEEEKLTPVEAEEADEYEVLSAHGVGECEHHPNNGWQQRNDGWHTAICAVCGEWFSEEHSFGADEITCISCSYQKHSHEFGPWERYDEQHGQKCLHCDEWIFEDHDFGSGDTCSECGFTNHEHQYANWQRLENCHVSFCAICNIRQEAPHTPGKDGVCTVCGYQNHVHVYGEWERHEVLHGAYCTLCDEWYPENHSFDENNICTVCGYQQHTHTYGEWGRYEMLHGRYCTQEFCDEWFPENHKFGADGACTVCGYQNHDHVFENWQSTDTNHSSKCSQCDEWSEGPHTFDENDICTVCGYSQHEHEFGRWSSRTGQIHGAECTVCGNWFEFEHTFNRGSTCTVCSYQVHEHKYGLFGRQETYHIGNCDLCDQIYQEDHSFDANDTCTVCGYQKHTHSFGKWYRGEAFHINFCTLPSCDVSYEGDHTFDANDTCTECSYTKHDHVFEHYDVDEYAHSAKCSMCDELSDGPHTFDENNVCTVCGYLNHEHKFDGWMDRNDFGHSAECTVCYDWIEIEHTFNSRNTCTACGYVKHAHVHTGRWYRYGDYHAGACTKCNWFTAPHDSNADGVCKVCGYKAHEHKFITISGAECSVRWNSFFQKDLVDQHIEVCSVTDCDESEMWAPHSFEDGVCTDCGYEDHVHAPVYQAMPFDHNCTCTICGGMYYEDHSFDENGICACGYGEDGKLYHSITFELGEGAVLADAPEMFSESAALSLTKLIPQREHYTFAGWYLNGKKVTSIVKGTKTDVTLEARWTPNVYKITYILNNGTLAPNTPKTYTYGVGVESIPDPTPLKGTRFLFWSDENEEPIKGIAPDASGDITLIAQFELIYYKVNCQGLEDVETEGNVPEVYSAYDCKSFGEPTKVGHTFQGWFLNGKTKLKPVNGEYTIPFGTVGDVTLVAKWKANTYKITYNVNGGTLGKGSPKTYTYGVGAASIPDAVTPKGYEFRGWWTEDGMEYDSISAEETGDLYLTAHWEATVYNASYELFDGTMETALPATFTASGSEYFGEPVREGYTFQGWYLNGKTKLKNVGGAYQIPAGTVGDVTVTAKWKLNTYKITYVLNGGKNAKNPVKYTVNDTVDILNPTLYGSDELFIDWYTDLAMEEPFTGNVADYCTNLTLYAKWNIDTVEITYDTDDELDANRPVTFDGGNRTKVTALDSFTLQAPVRPGYTFLGWYNAETGKKVTKISKQKTDMDLQARWKLINNITITLNGGKYKYDPDYPGKKPSTVYNPANFMDGLYVPDLNTRVVKKLNVYFNGWRIFDEAGNKCVQDYAKQTASFYKNGEYIGTYSYLEESPEFEKYQKAVSEFIPIGKVNFAATWNYVDASYNCTFYFNDGVSEPVSGMVAIEAKDSLAVLDAFRLVDANAPDYDGPGAQFLGWYTAPVGGSKVSKFSSGNIKDMVLYAHWKIVADIPGGLK